MLSARYTDYPMSIESAPIDRIFYPETPIGSLKLQQ
jgi:hypothetical protein